MSIKVSRRGAIPPFIVMDVLREANQRQSEHGDVLHLELGQPATRAPQGVIESAKRALKNELLGYTEAFGIISLRRRISDHYLETQNLTVDPSNIVVTTGSSAGFVLAFIAAFDSGDRVAMAEPGYPGYRNILLALGIEPVPLPAGPETRFQPTPELLDQVEGPIDGLIIASPSNPAGTMLGELEIKALTDYCTKHQIRLISDEIYHGITYWQPGVSALCYNEDAVIINSFSKYFSMTGWRVGWMIVPNQLTRSVECLAQNLFISPPTLSQYAAEAAFNCKDELNQNVQRYSKNRDLLLKELPKMAFNRLASADGAFYLYANIAHLTNDSEEFCRRMLNETGVAIAPGTDFDKERGRSYVRLSYSGEPADIADALRRVHSWIPSFN